MSLHAIYEWVFWPVTVLFALACGIWAVMLIGAWVASLDEPPQILKSVALKKVYSEKIMQSMVRELVTLIGAFGLLAAGAVQQVSLNRGYENKASTLLCYVRTYSTPPVILQSIKTLAEIPGSLQDTLKAYSNFLERPSNPNVEEIKKHLSKSKKSAYELRILGLSYYMLGFQKDPANSAAALNEAEKTLTAALEAAREDGLPGDPEASCVAHLQYAIENTIATIQILRAKGEIAQNGLTNKAKELLNTAVKEFDRHRTSPGNMPETYVNLMIAYSLLGKYQEALDVLSAVAKRSVPLGDFERKLVKDWIMDLTPDGMDEFLPLAEFIKKDRGLNWDDFVNREFQSKPVVPG